MDTGATQPTSTEGERDEEAAFEAACQRAYSMPAIPRWRTRVIWDAGRDYGQELRGADARDVAMVRRLVDALRRHGCNFNCFDDGADGPNTEICGKRALLAEVREAYPEVARP